MTLKTSTNKTLQTISAREFAGRFASGVRVSQQSFTWFLGAGCSKTSGILDASGLVQKWLKEQYELEASPSAFETWAKSSFTSFDPANAAALYAQAFARRHPSPVERQREIEMICSRGEPAYGYATLAQVLSHPEYGRYCNTILTTNFDDLIADALYLYGERHARPLVVTHEALARYVRTNSPRPTIVKLHGDAHLDPKNLQPETREINIALSKQLYPFLQDHALIFVGYGGNDQSILKFVQNCPVPALAPPIFWVSKREAPAAFHEWLCERGALRVDLTDFDQLMHLIRGALNIELIDRKRWSQIGDRYYEAFDKLKDEIAKLVIGSEDALALKIATSEAAKTLPDDWNFIGRARELINSNPDEAEKIFQEGLQNYPDSQRLNYFYGRFLEDVRKDMDRAENHFKLAITADPNHSDTLASYARFLEVVRRDMDAAEAYYRRSVEAEPNNAYAHTSYAKFLQSVRSNMDEAELHYKRAIDINPKYEFALTGYAVFLHKVRNDMDAAESYYKRAVDSISAYPYGLNEYASFLQNVRGDMDGAEACFRRAIELDPNYVYALGDYARFLQNVRHDMDAAETYFKRALKVDPESAYYRGLYDKFLEARRKA